MVVLRGEAAASTSVLCGTLSRVIAFGAGDVVIDLSELEFINSATVRALAVGQRLLERRGRELTLRSPPRPAARMLHTFGLTDLIEAGEAVRP